MQQDDFQSPHHTGISVGLAGEDNEVLAAAPLGLFDMSLVQVARMADRERTPHMCNILTGRVSLVIFPGLRSHSKGSWKQETACGLILMNQCQQ